MFVIFHFSHVECFDWTVLNKPKLPMFIAIDMASEVLLPNWLMNRLTKFQVSENFPQHNVQSLLKIQYLKGPVILFI